MAGAFELSSTSSRRVHQLDRLDPVTRAFDSGTFDLMTRL